MLIFEYVGFGTETVGNMGMLLTMCFVQQEFGLFLVLYSIFLCAFWVGYVTDVTNDNHPQSVCFVII